MKHFKIKLSVLALACLGAGALALQPTANVQAQATTPADCLTMVNGAAVYVSPEGAAKNFNGIRWTTKINTTVAAQLLNEYGVENVQFGTLVLPTSMLGEDNVLTEADLADALDLPANYDYEAFLEKYAEYQEWAVLEDDEDQEKAEKLFKNLPQTFYSIVSYDDLGANASAAYAMELTARSYVKIGDDYYFASLEDVDTSRSAKQVALATQLAGEFENDTTSYRANKAAAYYGAKEAHVPEVKSVGAIDAPLIDVVSMLTAAKQKKIQYDNVQEYFGDHTEDNIVEILIGTESVATAEQDAVKNVLAYKSGTLAFYVQPGEVLPSGEQYVSVLFDDGEIATFPITCATKVITTAEELAMFSAKGGYNDLSAKASLWKDYNNTTYDPYDDVDLGYWRPEQEQSGYYVLGANIDASAYVHGSRIAADYKEVTGKDAGEFNNSTWNGYTWYEGRPIGLTGTFNGMGYTISGMTIGSQREGFFGIVNGGTVKNVAFTDVKATQTYAYVLANYLINATIDNVYIETNKYESTDAENNPGYLYSTGSALVANTAYGTTKISNVLLRVNKWVETSAASTFGALFGTTHGDEKFTCENVFVYVRNHFKYMTESVKTVDGVDLTVYAEATAQYYTAMVTEKVAKRAKGESGQYTEISTKGSLYLAENQTLTALSNGTTFSANAYDVKHLTGVYYYGQNDAWGAYDPAGFLASGCWTAKSGSRPSWVTREQ